VKFKWDISSVDIEKLLKFIYKHSNNVFVRNRVELNLNPNKALINKNQFWNDHVACLLTSVQRSGPNSAVTRFIRANPFPLTYELCLSQSDLTTYAHDLLTDFSGLRRTNKIPDELSTNLIRLEQGLWDPVFSTIDALIRTQEQQVERTSAHFIVNNFKGFGPKQSRNLLQGLGLTKYEIPLDSRIIKWLNRFGFPIKLTAGALSDRYYYEFVLDAVHELCDKADIYPCVLDAIVFTSFDNDVWTEENLIN